jgi:type I restriction enzyme S subunit
MREWNKVTVDQIKSDSANALATGPFGSAISSKFFIENGVPVIRGGNLSADISIRLSEAGFVYVSNDKAEEFKRSVVRSGDLIFTCWGTINQVGLIDGKGLYTEYIISNKQMKLTPHPEKADSYYLYYFFSGPQMQEQILSNDIGSSVPGFNLGQLKSIEIDLPPLPEQKAIASVLSSLDDKIDLLHRQNKTLEAMAETLLRQWFVEEDWEDTVISELIDFNPSRKLSKQSFAPYLEMAALSTTTFAPEGWYDREFSSGTKFMNGDTLLARITPCLENGKTAFVTFLKPDQVGWGSTEFIVMRPKKFLHPFFAYTLSRNSDFRDYAESCMEGSSGRQRVNVDHLKQYDIKKPSPETISRFNVFAESTVQKLHANAIQIRTLENLQIGRAHV